jgi:hypothetical protein
MGKMQQFYTIWLPFTYKFPTAIRIQLVDYLVLVGNLYVNTLPFGIERQFFQKCRAYSQVISTVVFYVMPSDRLFFIGIKN